MTCWMHVTTPKNQQPHRSEVWPRSDWPGSFRGENPDPDAASTSNSPGDQPCAKMDETRDGARESWGAKSASTSSIRLGPFSSGRRGWHLRASLGGRRTARASPQRGKRGSSERLRPLVNHLPRHDERAFRVRVAILEQCLPKAQLFVPTTKTVSRHKEHRTDRW
jgi:hypothetical protein